MPQSPKTTDQPRAVKARQQCINPACAETFGVEAVLVACPRCGELLDVRYDWASPLSWETLGQRSSTRGGRPAGGDRGQTPSALDFSGVWRFRDLLPFFHDERDIVTLGEGRTNLQRADAIAELIGLEPGNLFLQYEGFNPSGSFKDNGMAAGFTHARMVGAERVACASTGNTSASLGMYAALTGTPCFVFIGSGKIAYGKLSQALEYGARTLQVAGDFDACLARVREIATGRPDLGVYLMNSVNPFRLEGQKTIMYRVLEGLDWRVPDWIVVPGGNLGNCSAFAKAFTELRELGMVDRVPRLAVVNASGARTLDRVHNDLGVRWNGGEYDREAVRAEYARMDELGERASTVASAIEINRPVNLPKALRALETMNGVVLSVDDHCIMEHKALVGRFGFGCEPASAASVAGVRRLVERGVIDPGETVACVLTGHLLKDPDATVSYHTGVDREKIQSATAKVMHEHGRFAIPTGMVSNRPIPVADDLDSILKAMGL